ncbi:DUF502 domain-containing protein [Halorientalis marina]|uniref:DUF502 domain-containing protein n=1 Tax=Halorientalis marina TaxID=2931976 RepID=UPI001FF6ACB5|nr:DUF502 domain-containing protein [Halorientalis marina]
MPLLVQDGPSLGGRLAARLRDALITGAAITIPLVVTLIVVGFVVNFVSNALNPLVTVVYQGLGLSTLPRYGVKVAAGITLLGLMIAIGLVAQRRPEDDSFESSFDQMMARIPGVGSIYTSFNEMSELLLDSDTDSFRDVKLVEFPVEGSYSIAFLTADTPDRVEDAAGQEEMQTVFLPMAPNPVMGGYVIHVPADRVVDVDMTVQEGIRSIVTSGVAIDDGEAPALSAREMQELSADPLVKEVAGTEPPGAGDPSEGDADQSETRQDRYDDAVDPEHASRADGIARRGRTDPDDGTVADGAPRTPHDLERAGDDTPRGDGPESAETETGKAADDDRSDTT